MSKLCEAGKPFEYYLAKADGDYPEAAKQLSQEIKEGKLKFLKI